MLVTNALWLNLYFHVESAAETTWWHEDIICEPENTTAVANEKYTPPPTLELWWPFFNFSLIVDPNDPLYEDEIKASGLNHFKTNVGKIKMYFCEKGEIWF